MGSAGKIILGIVVAVVVVVVIGVVLVFQNLDSIVKQVIEDVGSEVTGTAVRVSSVKLTVQEGRGEIYGLTIANPPGYQSSQMFSMDEVKVQIEPGSIRGPVIVIDEVLIDGARLTAEQKGTTTNVNELLDTLKARSADEEPAASAGPTDLRLMMEQFAFINSAGTVKTQQFGERELKIPDLRMSNLGDKSTDLTPEQLAHEMLTALIQQAQKAVGNYLGDMAKEAAAKEVTKQLDDKIGEENRKKLEGLKSFLKKD